MSMTNWMHLAGKVTNTAKMTLDDGRVAYKIRLGVPKTKYQIKNQSKKLGKPVGKSDFIEIVAFGDEHYDPWAEVCQNDDCVIEGEACEAFEFVDDETGKKTSLDVMGVFVRASWIGVGLDGKTPQTREEAAERYEALPKKTKEQIVRHTPSDAELPDED